MKGTLDDNVTEGEHHMNDDDLETDDDHVAADIISCVEFNQDGELLATGDKGGRVVIFQVRIRKHFSSEKRNYLMKQLTVVSCVIRHSAGLV